MKNLKLGMCDECMGIAAAFGDFNTFFYKRQRYAPCPLYLPRVTLLCSFPRLDKPESVRFHSFRTVFLGRVGRS